MLTRSSCRTSKLRNKSKLKTSYIQKFEKEFEIKFLNKITLDKKNIIDKSKEKKAANIA